MDFIETYALMIEVIVKREKGFYVLSHDKTKNLGGPYSTKKEAIKRLQQVEYFKIKGE